VEWLCKLILQCGSIIAINLTLCSDYVYVKIMAIVGVTENTWERKSRCYLLCLVRTE
jgi:hypothetical protein